MKTIELYEKYLQTEGLRKISKTAFMSYMHKLGSYDKVIEYLSSPKKTTNNKIGAFKRKDKIYEIVDYAKLFSIEKAAIEYDISTRTVRRYMDITLTVPRGL